jgi:flagellar assembly protein FliH
MPKNIFRPAELVELTTRVIIEPPGGYPAKPQAKGEEEEIKEADEYAGPTAEELRREAEAFRSQWEKEKETMVASARLEADKILKDAEASAFEEVQRKQNQAKKIRQEAEDQAKAELESARKEAAEIEARTAERLKDVERDAYKQGFDKGREDGYSEGRGEIQRLTDRLHVVLEKAMEKRAEILQESENEVIELVLLISRKVIKTISEGQKNVVVSNIAQALRKLKSRGDVIIRVNLADLALATEHVKDFMAMAENAKSISVMEDTTVDRGGCLIETDFGQIDARISSQLHEIEEKILDVSPIKARGKGV